VRKRVVRQRAETALQPALRREQHAVVVLCARIFSGKQISVELAFRWILQYQSPPLSGIPFRI